MEINFRIIAKVVLCIQLHHTIQNILLASGFYVLKVNYKTYCMCLNMSYPEAEPFLKTAANCSLLTALFSPEP